MVNQMASVGADSINPNNWQLSYYLTFRSLPYLRK
jgi:hypothetical protein